jgi:hypothetical protein
MGGGSQPGTREPGTREPGNRQPGSREPGTREGCPYISCRNVGLGEMWGLTQYALARQIKITSTGEVNNFSNCPGPEDCTYV